MPIKFSPSVVKLVKGSRRHTVEHNYMKCKSLKELLEYYNKIDNPAKKRQKVKNELVRRNRLGKSNIVFN